MRIIGKNLGGGRDADAKVCLGVRLGVANRTRTWRTSARGGASRVAPTAPHATEGEPGRKTGPERFWDLRRVRIAAALALVASSSIHVAFSPWTLLPHASGIELHDVADELTIPIDLLGDDNTAPQEPEEQHPSVPDPPSEQEGPGGKDAGPKPKPDAGARDAGQLDASPTDSGAPDAALIVSSARDASTIAANDQDAAPVALTGLDAGAVASISPEGGAGVPGAGGPRSPAEILGMSSVVTAGQVNVTLLVNVAVIRTHPVGSRLGPLLQGIPQWADFIHGAETKFDPLQAADWILIFGPSLIHTDRDAVFVRYNLPDKAIDDAVDTVSRLSASRGGAFDAGVPGIHAAKTFADNGERVMMRVQPGLLLVVPPDKAAEFAKVYKRTGVSPRVRPGEALRLTVKDPWRQISIPNLKFPNTLSELRFWIIPHNDDGSADVYGEGDCGTPEHAVEVADALREMIKRLNASMLVKIATHGLLNGAEIDPAGDKVKMHLGANRDQLEALLGLVAAQFGVNIPPPPGGAPR
jgi:hypothetical protein